MADIVEVLKTQHQEVKTLLGQGMSAFPQLQKVIPPHETAEEKVVYPAIEATGSQGQQVARSRLAEQQRASQMLEQMSGQGPGSSGFESMFQQFTTSVEAHAQAEETEVFPILESLPNDQRTKMAENFTKAQEQAKS